MNRIKLMHRDTLSCEPILRRMPNGELLCVCQCGDVTEPAPLNRVYAFHSSDNGETWSKGTSVWPEDGQAVYLTEVTVVGDEITVFLTLHKGYFTNWKCVMIKSRDNGYTWEDAGAPPYFPTYTFMRGLITLKNGDQLIAYQHYPIDEKENQRLLDENLKWVYANVNVAENGVIKSSDGGKTWKKCEGPSIPFGGENQPRWVWSEPTIVELEPNHVAMLLRIDTSGKLWESHSYDGGETWSEIVATEIPNPTNKPKLIALPDGAVALIHTPNPTHGFDYRNPLEIWYSYDGLKTWEKKHRVTDFPGCYCYPDGIYEDGHILFSIEYNRHDILFIDHEVEAR